MCIVIPFERQGFLRQGLICIYCLRLLPFESLITIVTRRGHQQQRGGVEKARGGREPWVQDLTSARQAIHLGATSRAEKAKTAKFTRDLPHEPFNQASIYKPNHQIYYEQLVGEKMTDVITERKKCHRYNNKFNQKYLKCFCDTTLKTIPLSIYW